MVKNVSFVNNPEFLLGFSPNINIHNAIFLLTENAIQDACWRRLDDSGYTGWTKNSISYH